jgi:hypothetical protein
MCSGSAPRPRPSPPHPVDGALALAVRCGTVPLRRRASNADLRREHGGRTPRAVHAAADADALGIQPIRLRGAEAAHQPPCQRSAVACGVCGEVLDGKAKGRCRRRGDACVDLGHAKRTDAGRHVYRRAVLVHVRRGGTWGVRERVIGTSVVSMWAAAAACGREARKNKRAKVTKAAGRQE